MKNKGNKPARTRVVMNEAAGFEHVEACTPAQLRNLASDSPAWLAQCRSTRTDTEGSKA